MKTKLFFVLSGAGFLIITSAIFYGLTFAQNIQYPVAELGNCENESNCREYCDQSENMNSCLDFAQKHNLMSEDEIARAKKFLAAGGQGPGGCASQKSCEEYCNDISHIDECIAYGEEHNLIPPEELEEAKKVQAAIRQGIQPPPCGNKRACDVYCEESSHMEECIAFGEAAGFIQGQELEDARKMLAALKRGVVPPPCRGKEECDEYCGAPENMELCINFALEAGFMSEEEKEGAQKMLEAIKKGVKPLNCRGKEECDVYCGQEQNFEECLIFAEAAGFMSAEDAAMARKTGGKGPGGCKTKEGCEAFCQDPNNEEICFNFAKEHGLISEEDLRKMDEGKQQMMETLTSAPAEVIDCLNSSLGNDLVENMKSGNAVPSREIGDKMQECFMQMAPPPEMGPLPETNQEGMMPPQSGPGGCASVEECQNYCQNNPQECQNFGQGSGEITPQNWQQPPEGYQIPEGQNWQEQIPPEFQHQLPTDFQQPPEFQQPPSESQPPSTETPPPSGLNPKSFLGSIISVFRPIINLFLGIIKQH